MNNSPKNEKPSGTLVTPELSNEDDNYSSFTEKTLEEFREKMTEGIQTRILEQWLSTKLEESAVNERSRILSLIDSRINEYSEGRREWPVPESLTSLAAELDA